MKDYFLVIPFIINQSSSYHILRGSEDILSYHDQNGIFVSNLPIEPNLHHLPYNFLLLQPTIYVCNTALIDHETVNENSNLFLQTIDVEDRSELVIKINLIY